MNWVSDEEDSRVSKSLPFKVTFLTRILREKASVKIYTQSPPPSSRPLVLLYGFIGRIYWPRVRTVVSP